MKAKRHILIMLLALGIASCQHYDPSSYKGMPKAYTLAYEEIYGQCYDSVPYAVVGLDLYSEGIKLDTNHHISGTGHNLYISDIFVPDCLLVEGRYKSIPKDSLTVFDYQHCAFRFLPGRDYEGYPYGMYVLTIEENKVSQIQVLDSGSFVYRNDSLLFTLYYTNAYGYRATYECYFAGALLPWQKK